MIALGADHGGVTLKDAVKQYLEQEKIAYHDYGTYNTDSVDYAPIGFQVAQAVVKGEAEQGILCCGTGIGISMAANKVKGIRAAVVSDAFCAEFTRRHNDANILCMGGRVVSAEQAVEFTRIFLNTPFDGGRHQRRIDQIAGIERGETL